MFYTNYLEKMKPIKIPKGHMMITKRSRPDEIFFILKGEVLNNNTKKVFSVGSIIGETDFVLKRQEREEEFISINTVYALKLKRADLD